ncbi:ammonium transporter [Geomicrobium sediminis]|uniref:Ammonium transporter n=1 Tax=Geomicrobium sediminis TaxID=1347788 RepID=A0ABS2P8L5_9BACL|nr:ammonium transporter [Geomicrobium sediminis]MBM7631420.1 Amt family ammonium transporter [Geomicrobium sediminis]
MDAVAVDTMWVMIATFLVFFMHAGFAMLETGFSRSKNAVNILMKNLLTMATAVIAFYVVGFAFMFGDTAGGILGMSGFALSGVDDIGFFAFQAMFAATCATIISGAVAERMKLGSYIALAVAMVVIIYPMVGHWIWSDNGWLANLGFVDFAGSTVVHFTGAAAAAVAVFILGGRIGKYNKDGSANAIPGHNLPLGALGVFILWFGWFGFNGGSTLSPADPLLTSIVVCTALSASGGVVATALYTMLKYKRVDGSLTMNGALAGLVGITAGAADVAPIGALIMGLVAGVILVEAVALLDNKLKLDDPVGAIAVHGICGIWGTVAVGLFALEGGLFYGGGVALLGIQALGVAAVMAWVLGSTFVVVKIIGALGGGIRVSEEEELAGLDFSEHGSNAYDQGSTALGLGNRQSTAGVGEDLITRLDSIAKDKKGASV